MQKKTIIKAIQKIISKHGTFSNADINGEASPVIGSLGRVTQYAEIFEENSVEAYMYIVGEENEIDTDTIAYEDLSKEVLEEILRLAENYEADCLQTEKRIS